MRHESIDGVVVRVRDYGDHDRYLSVLTAKAGRITILSKGGHSLKGPQTAISQLYTYANFEYYRKGEFNILKGGSAYQHFYALSMDIDRLNLAAYLCDLACELTDDGEPAPEMLRLLLNSLYAISKGKYTAEKIKAAFEIRATSILGFMPDILGCHECDERSGDFFLDVMGGNITCRKCKERSALTHKEHLNPHEAHIICLLSEGAKIAFGYCVYSPIERIFAFNISDADMKLFARAAEEYLLNQFGHSYKSLDFYKTIIR